MVELSKERIEEILQKETLKKEELEVILRAVYTRYMHLYETYFADIDALNDAKIAELRSYHEETSSLVKYYYMDIPLDICEAMRELDKNYTDNLLGVHWHKYLSGVYDEFKKNRSNADKSEEADKAQFKKDVLDAFYDAMDYVFRDGFGTGSEAAKSLMNGITELFFGKKQ